MDTKFTGRIEKGFLKIDNVKGFQKYLNSLEGNKIQAIVRKYKTTRSNEQNRYYWGVVIKILGEEFGYMPEETHEALKWKFLRKGGKLETVISTTSLNTTEFEIFLEKVRIWALTDFRVKIPLPNEIEF